MSQAYCFSEVDAEGYCKIGSATKAGDNYRSRFARTRHCNPRPMQICWVIQFESVPSAKQFEQLVKREFPKYGNGGDEWFAVNPTAVLQNPVVAGFIRLNRGFILNSTPGPKTFSTSLNLGCMDKYRPNLYMFQEVPDQNLYRLALTAYGWRAVERDMLTYNPRNIKIVRRWHFSSPELGIRFVEELKTRISGHSVWPDSDCSRRPDDLRSSPTTHNWYRTEKLGLISEIEILNLKGNFAKRYDFDMLFDNDRRDGRVPIGL